MTPAETRRRETDPELVTHAEPAKKSDFDFALPKPAKISRARAFASGAIFVIVLAAVFVMSYLPVYRDKQSLVAAAHRSETKTWRVEVVTPTAIASDRSLTLPGSMSALEETVIYPRASGYVRKWNVDIGDKVKEGDTLAEIDTPEVDHQITQAKAQLAQAEAGLELAKANAAFSKQNVARYEKLAPEGVASQQEFEKARVQADVDEASVTVARSNVEAQRANLQRLAQMKSFAHVVAPFAGSIVERNVARGALVTAGNASPLFRLAANDPVRVFVQVPQDVAPGVAVGSKAIVKVREFAGREFEGQLARAAGALDSSTRTMNVEVRVPNPKGELLAGMYAEVSLSLPTPHRVFAVPATALLNDAKGLRVAVLGADNHVRWVTVVVERDTGATVEIASGVDGTERVVKLASVELAEGQLVEIAKK
jgi:RND family efflux transporter MFP subunit